MGDLLLLMLLIWLITIILNADPVEYAVLTTAVVLVLSSCAVTYALTTVIFLILSYVGIGGILCLMFTVPAVAGTLANLVTERENND